MSVTVVPCGRFAAGEPRDHPTGAHPLRPIRRHGRKARPRPELSRRSRLHRQLPFSGRRPRAGSTAVHVSDSPGPRRGFLRRAGRPVSTAFWGCSTRSRCITLPRPRGRISPRRYPAARASISASSGNRPSCFFEKTSFPSMVISKTPDTPLTSSTSSAPRSISLAFARRARGS